MLEDDKTYFVRALVVGRAESVDEHAAYELKGLFKRDTGVASVALVGSVIKTIIHEDDVAWDATLVAADGGGAGGEHRDLVVVAKAVLGMWLLYTFDRIVLGRMDTKKQIVEEKNVCM